MTLAPPDCDRPELSVVMVAYGAWPLTERAIAALAAHTHRPFEVIVVDNASKDQTRAQLIRMPNVRVILNDENRGFGPATNQGAEQARGDYLLLLNTDAFVHQGWLEPLLEALAEPSVGAAVPRYLHADGSLQEAAVLLAQNGHVIFYGDGDDPDKSCYRFRRRVDFGSAACMLIRRATFAALQGFDNLFAPAYYEDSDLCLRLAQRGLLVMYEPRSTITHLRHGSGSLEAAAELSERHRMVFIKRWGSRLAGRPPTFMRATEQTVIAARDALATPRILICARADDSRAEQLASALQEAWPRGRLTWALDPHTSDGFDAEEWLAAGVEILADPGPSWLSGRLFHYDAVVLGRDTSPELVETVDRTQPQAPRFLIDRLTGPRETLKPSLVVALAEAGIA